MDYNIEIIKSHRRSIELQIKPDLKVVVRTPLFITDKVIKNLLDEKSDWIKSRIEIQKARNEQLKDLAAFTDSEIKILKEKSLALITPKAEYYAGLLGVTYKKLTVKKQRSCWGSCSAKRNINFNLLLCLCPETVVDYIVVHELCHLKQLNHSPLFWTEVEKLLPDYRSAKQWLKTEGQLLIKRLA